MKHLLLKPILANPELKINEFDNIYAYEGGCQTFVAQNGYNPTCPNGGSRY